MVNVQHFKVCILKKKHSSHQSGNKLDLAQNIFEQIIRKIIEATANKLMRK